MSRLLRKCGGEDRQPGGKRRTRQQLRTMPASLALAVALVLVTACVSALSPAASSAAVSTRGGGVEHAESSGAEGGSSLEAAAAKAGATGRAVAMSLIGLAFAVAATVLAFRRDFKEAAGVFAVGIVSVLLATPTGLSLLRDTVGSLFGGR